jgi:hypothetical protein
MQRATMRRLASVDQMLFVMRERILQILYYPGEFVE